jgi:alpha-L-rhamnosidase
VARLFIGKATGDTVSLLAKNSKAAFVKEYVSDDGRVTGNIKVGYALALDFDLVPENLKQGRGFRDAAIGKV